MSLRVRVLQHVPFETPGAFETWSTNRGHQLAVTHLYRGEPVPEIQDFDWLVLLGGPMGVGDVARFPWLSPERTLVAEAVSAEKTVLGFCLGAQLIARALGAEVGPNAAREIGWFPVTRAPGAAPLFCGLPDCFPAFHWHGDRFAVPEGAVRAFSSEACDNQAFSYGDRVVALQFHLETTPLGAAALIEHCADELAPGPYVQEGVAMLAPPDRFQVLNGLLIKLCDALVDQG